MRIALVHSFYRSGPSGENAVVELQAESLSRAGHEVALVSRSTDTLLHRPLYSLEAAYRVITGRGTNPLEQIEFFGPDVVHVHNLFPNFGDQWMLSAKQPIVVTQHNFRSVCAAGILWRDGSHCELCPTAGTHHGVRHGCYRGSRIKTIPLALGNMRQRRQQTPSALRTIIYLSSAARSTVQRLSSGWEGVPSRILPNFLPDKTRSGEPNTSGRPYWLYAGRLSAEKGVAELVNSWPAGFRLVIAGSGPLGDRVAVESRSKQIELRGQVSSSELQQLMEGATGLIFSSLWQEHSPMVVIEALRAGLPVLARSETSVSAELVSSGAGLSYSNSEELRNSLRTISMNSGLFSLKARHLFEESHSEKRWLHKLSSIYYDAIGKRS